MTFVLVSIFSGAFFAWVLFCIYDEYIEKDDGYTGEIEEYRALIDHEIKAEEKKHIKDKDFQTMLLEYESENEIFTWEVKNKP